MRVCIVNEFFYPDSTGGTGAVLSELARSLSDGWPGLEIDVVTTRRLYRGEAAQLQAVEDWDGIRIRRLSTPEAQGKGMGQRLIANLLFSFSALGFLLRQRRFDAILISTAPPTLPIAARLLRSLTGTPFVYVVYDLEPDRAVCLHAAAENGRSARMLRRFQRQWLQTAETVVVLGRCMRDYIHQRYDVEAQKIAVIPIGAEPDALRPQRKATRFREAHGLTGFVALYSGNFGRYHDFDTLLDAARALRGQPITFVLVGGGAQAERIAGRIADDGLENVRLFPFVAKAEYEDLMASADVSLVTLEPGMEGLCVPSKFYSILASGRATLALVGKTCEVARVLDEENCGIQIDPGDRDQLIAALTRLADDPATVERMGMNARRALVSRFATRQIAEQYYAVLCAAAGKPQDAAATTRGAATDVPGAR